MDVSSVSAPSVTIPSRPQAGAQGLVQAPTSVPSSIAARPDPAFVKTDSTSGSLPPNAGTLAASAARDEPSSESLTQAVKQVNDSFKQKGQNLYASFEKDKITGINLVKIVDKKTNETISQIPSKEIVALAQFLENPEGMRGKLIHATA